jgi:hypothetical protein
VGSDWLFVLLLFRLVAGGLASEALTPLSIPTKFGAIFDQAKSTNNKTIPVTSKPTDTFVEGVLRFRISSDVRNLSRISLTHCRIEPEEKINAHNVNATRTAVHIGNSFFNTRNQYGDSRSNDC